MALSKKSRLVLEWTVARDDTEALLRAMLDAKTRCQRELHKHAPRAEAAPATDQAIASLRHMARTLERCRQTAQRTLTDEDLALLPDEPTDRT